MALEVIWLDSAKDDLRAILSYIDARAPSAARVYVAGIRELGNQLALFPTSGRQYNAMYRCLVYRNHILFYRHNAEAGLIEIAAVIDGRRDLNDIIGEAD